MKEQIKEMAIEEMSRFITCVDIETEPDGTCCRMNFDQADTMACALYNADYRKQKEGEWIYVHTYMRGRCSICNAQMQYDNQPFCSNCGAQMRGGEND